MIVSYVNVYETAQKLTSIDSTSKTLIPLRIRQFILWWKYALVYYVWFALIYGVVVNMALVQCISSLCLNLWMRGASMQWC